MMMVGRTTALLAAGAVMASPALAQDIDTEERDLLIPVGGTAFDARFGSAVAVSEAAGVVVAGEPDAEVGEFPAGVEEAGRVYMFDAETGDQLMEITMQPEPEANAHFGETVAVSDDSLFIGADTRNSDFVYEGFLYDLQSGALRAVLNGESDAAPEFGDAAAIGDGIVVIGSYGANDACDEGFFCNSGAIYIYNEMTGDRLDRIAPSDLSEGDNFGFSVDVGGGFIVVGARLQGESGAVYVFDSDSFDLVRKLHPDHEASGSRFGRSVSIDAEEGLIAVGSPEEADDDIGSFGGRTGIVYLFNLVTGELVERFGARDGLPQDRFGMNVSASDGRLLVAAPGVNTGPTLTDDGVVYVFDTKNARRLPEDIDGSAVFMTRLITSEAQRADDLGFDDIDHDGELLAAGAVGAAGPGGGVYLFPGDRDRDGLMDPWETEGIDADRDGTIDLDLPALGADPDRKDIFIEVDAFDAHAPQTNLVRPALEAVFDSAPVPNPDGSTGISLHLSPGAGSGMLDERVALDVGFPNGLEDLDVFKNDHFGTPAQRADPNWENIEEAKKKAFRYAVFAKSHSNGTSSGLAEVVGNDMIVTLGSPPWVDRLQNDSNPAERALISASTFMHELGHTMGLHHGGQQLGERFNHKPNYRSVMNYSWQTPSPAASGWSLDYSRVQLPTLDESILFEPDGVQGAQPGTMPAGPPQPMSVPLVGAVDWNRDGDTSDNAISVDINNLEPGADTEGLDVLLGHDDWSNIRYAIGRQHNFGRELHPLTTLGTEMDVQTYDLLQSVPARCPADLTGDGAIDFADLNAFVAAFQAGDPSADLSGDGVIGEADLSAFVASFSAGCP